MGEIRPIDANALKEDLRQYFTDGVIAGVSARLVFNQILCDIDNAPTLNLEKTSFMKGYNYGCDDGKRFYERPQGRWEYTQYDGNPNIGNWHCSECRHIVTGMYISKPEDNFCPYCGADMRKEGNE